MLLFVVLVLKPTIPTDETVKRNRIAQSHQPAEDFTAGLFCPSGIGPLKRVHVDRCAELLFDHLWNVILVKAGTYCAVTR